MVGQIKNPVLHYQPCTTFSFGTPSWVRIAILNAKIVEQQYHICFHHCQFLLFNLSSFWLKCVGLGRGLSLRFPRCWWWRRPSCWAEMTSWLCWTLTGHSGPPVGTLLTVISKSWVVNHFRHMIFQGHCMHRTSPYMKSLDCNDDHWLRVWAIRACFYESFALKQMPFTPTLFSPKLSR